MSEPTRMLPATRLGWAGLAAALGGLAVLPYFVAPYYVGLVTVAMIAALLALSLHLLVGATGLVSLGHGAFYGLAAYTVYLVSPEGAAQPIWLTLPAAMAMAGLAAFLVGTLSLRTKGFFFLMVTLAFGQMIYFVFHDTKLGGGTDGAYLAKPLITAFGATLDPMDLPRSRRAWPAYYVALVQLALTYAGLAWLLGTLFGRVLEGIRVNEHRMQAMGFDTTRYKLVAFTIAGTLAGAAGHMWALHSGFVNPELVSWHKSAEALLMILLGGIGSLAGAIVGAFAFVALGEVPAIGKTLAEFLGPTLGGWVETITERKLLVEGLVVLASVLLLRNGLMGMSLRRPASRSGTSLSAEDADDAAGGAPAKPVQVRHG
jgi:branched-chain amino acid transport system permease protein